MTRPTALLVRLLRYLSSIIGTSIKRLLALLNFIKWRISIIRGISPKAPDDPPSQPQPDGILLSEAAGLADLQIGYVCPSFAPRAEHVTLDLPLHDHVDDNDGLYTTMIHSASPTQTSFSGHGTSFSGHVTSIPGQGSLYAGSSRAILIEEEEASGSDTTSKSVNSRGTRRSTGHQLHAAGTSAISVLPISTHGLQMVTAGPGTPISQRPASPMLPRPTSWSSQKSGPPAEPIKISSPNPPPRQLTPPPITTPGGTPSRSSSPKNSPSILPMSTSTVQRWKRGVKVSTEFNHCLVGRYNFEFKDNPPPDGWAACHHPEGALYFFHAEQRVFTDVFMHDPEKAAMVNEAASQILSHIHRDGLGEETVVPKEYDLVIELVERADGIVVGYYFADHASRLLFWTEEFDASTICREITCVVSFSHLRLEIESQYWTHYELYPNCRGYTTELRDEVRGLLLHAATDQITSVTSTALWTKEENLALLTIVEKLQVDHPANRVCAGAIVGRVMRNLKHIQFIMLYGQYGARLDCDQSVHGIVVHSHSWYLKSIEPFMFWGADVHLVSLEKIWVDRTIHIVAFRRFIGKLNEEWQDFIIVATVLLNANMAFLSIQSVDNGGFTVMNRSAAQIVSYISIVTSLGSALLSLLLLRQNRSKGRLSADVVAKFLGNVTCMARGLENLAILYALPYALLMWSTLTFLVAFALDCFVRASLVTRVPVGSVLALCITLVIRFFIAAWLCEFDRIHRLRNVRKRLRERARAIFGMVLGGSVDDGGDKQAGEDERKESGETATACETAPATPKDKRKHSRSSTWMPRIFVRGATGDDLNMSAMAPHAEMNGEV